MKAKQKKNLEGWKFYNDFRQIGIYETEQIIEGTLKDKKGTEFFIEIYHTIPHKKNDAHIVINVLEEDELQISKSCADTIDYVKAELKDIFEELNVTDYWLLPPDNMLKKIMYNRIKLK